MALGSNSPSRRPDPFSAFSWVQQPGSELIVSRCLSCGLIVAASKSRSALRVAENAHQCPVYLNYDEQSR